MTGQPPAPRDGQGRYRERAVARSGVRHFRDALAIATSLLLLLGGVATIVIWLTGGFRPQTQVAVDHLIEQMTGVSGDVKEIKAKLESMPRPADYTAQDTHMGRIDQSVDDMRNRMTRDEIDFAALRARVERLDGLASSPIRAPR